jgi:hypothetical protein
MNCCKDALSAAADPAELALAAKTNLTTTEPAGITKDEEVVVAAAAAAAAKATIEPEVPTDSDGHVDDHHPHDDDDKAVALEHGREDPAVNITASTISESDLTECSSSSSGERAGGSDNGGDGGPVKFVSSLVVGAIDNVKRTAIGQYEGFKTSNPDFVRAIEGAVHDVTKVVTDHHLQQKEKSEIEAFDRALEDLEAELQAFQRMAWGEYSKYWPSPLDGDEHNDDDLNQERRSQLAIKQAMLTARITVAAAKKTAISSLEQAMDTAMVAREAKFQSQYITAVKAARQHRDNLTTVGGEESLNAAKKVENGLIDAQSKVQEILSNSIASYDTALKDAQTNLGKIIHQVVDETKKLEQLSSGGLAATSSRYSKDEFDKARRAVWDVAKRMSSTMTPVRHTNGARMTTAVKSNLLEKFYNSLKKMAIEDVLHLKTLSLSKAEEFETAIRAHDSQVRMAKKHAMIEYQKTLESVTIDVKALSTL